MSGFMRDTQHPPRASHFIAMYPGNLHLERLQPFIDDLWAELMARLGSPIAVSETESVRQVTFLSACRYDIDRRTGSVGAATLDPSGTDFVVQEFVFAVDPPLFTTGWMRFYLNGWLERMRSVLIDHERPGPCWATTVVGLFARAVLRSTYWKRLRYALRAALDLDPQILRWSRQGRSRHVNGHVTNRQYNRTVAHRAAYARIQRDNPNLVWLYTLMLDENIALPSGEAIAAMKTYLLRRKVSPAGWRILALGREQDFRHLRDWIGAGGELNDRLWGIAPWLRFLVALRRKTVLPAAIQRLFLHDTFNRSADGRVRFRHVWLDVAVVNSLLKEAERRLARGGLHAFVQGELIDVLTWLERVQPSFDKNQLKAGWKSLATRAAHWQVEAEAADQLKHLTWRSALPVTTIDTWTVVPIEDAWQLRQEALRQHHCADSYLRECLVGEHRLFSVKNRNGHPVATIGIERRGKTWQSYGIRLSCNRAVTGTLVGLDVAIASRYADLWRLSQPVPPTRPAPVLRDKPIHVDCGGEIVCPICQGDEAMTCEVHAVASYDVFRGHLIGGTLDRCFDTLIERTRHLLAGALSAGILEIGMGGEFEKLLANLRHAVVSGMDMTEAIDNEFAQVKLCLLDLLLEQPKVAFGYCDCYGGMPPMVTTYKTYWAEDADAAVVHLETRLAEMGTWIDEVSDPSNACRQRSG